MRALAMTAIAVALLASSAGRGAAPAFYPDDPLWVDDDRALDATGIEPIEGSNAFDFAEHTFLKPGDRRDVRAVNVNTVDEVPDSSWFTNRIGRRPMSIDELVRAQNTHEVTNIDGWPVVEGKSSGVTPGYRVMAPDGRLHQVKLDPPSHPEMASGAEMIGSAIYHAVGYNVVEGYVVEVDPAAIVVAPTATTVDLAGRRRPMTREDVLAILDRGARRPDGTYRVTLSRFADGAPLGYFRYFGTRPDDPNDIHPHEHRRELRGSRVFAAWVNHDDSRGLNSLAMLDSQDGRRYVKHYMFDFGSILGSGSTQAQSPRAGNEYILEWAPALKSLATLGLWVRPWARVDYREDLPAVGRFESDFFDPAAWRPEYPNPAFDNMRPDDAFWAARIVSRFSDEAIRAVVGRARYSDPEAAAFVADTLIARRDKVLRAWLTGVNPLADAALSPQGVLTFANAAVSAGVAGPVTEYRLTWSRFDNAAGGPTGETVLTTSRTTETNAPDPILQNAEFVTVAVTTTHPDYPGWAAPVRFTFRREGANWLTVGVDRTVY
jgi:hypothetical protein